MAIKKAGLILFTDRPGYGLVAVCQERGRYNFEKGGKDESWRGALQVTIHGGLEVKDVGDADLCLIREATEECGSYLGLYVQSHMNELGVLHQGDDCVTKGLRVPFEVIGRIQLHAGSGGLRFVSPQELGRIQNLKEVTDKTCFISSEELAMFPDEVMAIEAGFDRYKMPV